jgi:hypothetical protein
MEPDEVEAAWNRRGLVRHQSPHPRRELRTIKKSIEAGWRLGEPVKDLAVQAVVDALEDGLATVRDRLTAVSATVAMVKTDAEIDRARADEPGGLSRGEFVAGLRERVERYEADLPDRVALAPPPAGPEESGVDTTFSPCQEGSTHPGVRNRTGGTLPVSSGPSPGSGSPPTPVSRPRDGVAGGSGLVEASTCSRATSPSGETARIAHEIPPDLLEAFRTCLSPS